MLGREQFQATIFDKITQGAKASDEELFYDREELLNSIRENIEIILNNRSFFRESKASYRPTFGSFLSYGIADYTLKDLNKPEIAEEFAEEAKRKIEAFEPRLKGVHVSFQGGKDSSSAFHLKISAVLNMKNVDEDQSNLSFSTKIIPSQKSFELNLERR